MKGFVICAALFASVVGCASVRPLPPGQRLALYQSHAGAPVSSFRYFGTMDNWESVGNDAVAVWTRPHEAWLLQLAGPCNGLEYTPVIGLTSQIGRVESGFDNVLVNDHSAINIPCRIRTIRPLDVKAIQQAERTLRGQAPGASQ